MPNLEVSKKDLEKLMGCSYSREKLEEDLEYIKGEIDSLENDSIKIDCKETNRPDLWSVEGIAREFKARKGDKKGLVKYKVKKSNVDVFINSNLLKVRPLIACAIIKNVKVSEELLIQLIQLQEKVGENYGRRRKELGIGLYDFDIMQPPIYYKGFKDDEIEFVPLEWRVQLRPSEILAQHDKGKAYAHLLKDADVYPIVIDANRTVASMPPIINSQITGKVTDKTKNLFIEVTGFKWETICTALEVMCMSLADRGGVIYSCKLHFPTDSKPYPKKIISTPLFKTEKMVFDKSLVKEMTGLDLKDKEIIDLLSRARFNTKIKSNKISVEYSSYRTDIMHPVDVIEDLLISFGFNNIEPEKIEMNVIGSELPQSKLIDFVREGCVGLGLQEVMTYNLTSIENQANRMNLVGEELVEIENPVSINYAILRRKLTPQLLDFFSKNKDKEYPQKIFELGTCLEINEGAENGVAQTNNICVALTHSNVNFTEIKSVLVSLCKYLGKECVLKKKSFSFLSENSAEITVNGKKGFIGEVKKEVVDSFNLRKPVCVFEFEI
ncbi:MAG: phenylalanine--tRNA ligase subunit beta [Candidatus ainarchaeum sp.]|jgi:phenylalanyl-tRNA synthetase beta chain|nr:phenylalanine--tRNA ligase subunit beta [Candidatus ainarchaeum sp.]MDD4128184.1 phenylalanine--tRNA ligase subunit beta [Candidatus ainarchaeum sp.]